MTKSDLLTRFIADIEAPMTMPEILRAIPSVDPMDAGIAITQAVLTGGLQSHQAAFKTHWPLYYRGEPKPTLHYWVQKAKRMVKP